MTIVLTILLFVLGVFAALAIGGGLLVLLAFGVGWLLDKLIQVGVFQATILALGGMLAFGILVERIWRVIISPPPFSSNIDDDECDDELDDEYDDDDEYEIEPPVIVSNPRIPRWRQPLKPVDFSDTSPDDRCPCGSGRKYKNCHGAKQAK